MAELDALYHSSWRVFHDSQVGNRHGWLPTAEERINTIWLEPESPSVSNYHLMFNINNQLKNTGGIRAS